MAGNFECFHCLSRGVIWDSDFSFEDYGYDGDGIVHVLHCTECGAGIEYRVPIEGGGDDTDEDGRVGEGETPPDEGEEDVQGGTRGQAWKEGSEMEGRLVDHPQDRGNDGVGAGQDRIGTPGWWVFTFGMGHEHRGHYVRIYGTFSEARAEMTRRFGSEWAFQYSEDAWQETVRSMTAMGWPVETELEERYD